MASIELTRGRPRPDREKHMPGEAGVWILILGDICVFAMLFAVYLFYRGQDPGLFAEGQATLNRNLGALNTVLLLVSSLFVVISLQALRRNLLDLSKRMVLSAALCGIGFVAVKAFEYAAKIGAGHTPDASSFYMYYFVLTGLHLGHLIVGLVVLTILYRMLSSSKEWTPRRLSIFEGGTCFWHMVDLLWIVLFPLIFLVR